MIGASTAQKVCMSHKATDHQTNVNIYIRTQDAAMCFVFIKMNDRVEVKQHIISLRKLHRAKTDG